MKLLTLLLFTVTLYAQNNVVTAGGDIENFSYTVGNNLVELQIPVLKDVALSIPKYEIEEPVKIIEKKKSFLQKIVEFFKNLLTNKNKNEITPNSTR